MKIVRTLSFTLLFISALTVNAALLPVASVIFSNDAPAKTIILKHPAAANIDQYFASATMVAFEVYKAGTKAELDKIVAEIKSNPAIESCNVGIVTGEYQAITITLKTAQNKAWFVALFKKAGLNTIRVNANPVVEVDKL